MRLAHGCVPALMMSSLVLAGCDASADPGPASSSPAPSATGDGTVLVQLEKIDGMLIEGFKLSVRLESPPGHALVASTWADLVRRQNADGAGTDLSKPDLYTSVVRTSVPAGPFVLSTVMHPGMESEQPTCVTRGQVEAGATVSVTVRFSGRDGCAVVS